MAERLLRSLLAFESDPALFLAQCRILRARSAASMNALMRGQHLAAVFADRMGGVCQLADLLQRNVAQAFGPMSLIFGNTNIISDLCLGCRPLRSDDTSVGAARTSAYATMDSRVLRWAGYFRIDMETAKLKHVPQMHPSMIIAE
jgi:hypothetical protein